MKPIYFPFTFIAEPVVHAVCAFFRQIVVYQPSGLKRPELMQTYHQSGRLQLRIPFQYDEEKMDAILKDYQRWVQTHQGGELAFIKSLQGSPPFFETSSTSQISSDLRKQIKQTQTNSEPDSKSRNQPLHASIFLHIAQQWDMQKYEVLQDLMQFEAMEENLFKTLKGDPEGSGTPSHVSPIQPTDDPGSYMTSERLQAWSYLAQSDQIQLADSPSGLFITSSRAVLDHLIDNIEDVHKVLTIDSTAENKNRVEEVQKWQDEWMQFVDSLAKCPWSAPGDTSFETVPPGGSGPKISLTLYLIPGQAPQELFARIIHGNAAPKENNNKGIINTVIGLLEF